MNVDGLTLVERQQPCELAKQRLVSHCEDLKGRLVKIEKERGWFCRPHCLDHSLEA